MGHLAPLGQAQIPSVDPPAPHSGDSLVVGLSWTGGGPQMPLWLHAGRDGRIHQGEERVGLFEAGYRRAFDPGPDWIQAEAGFNLLTRVSDGANSVHFNELYGHLDLAFMRLSLGRFREQIGLHDGLLSSGGMMLSRNATPTPKIRLSTPDFVDVPGSRGYVSFKARWSEGLLDDSRYVDGARVHQKYLFLRIQPVAELDLMGGIVHNLVWGGEHPERGRLHNSFDTYFRDITARSHESSITPLGNGLGAYDFGFRYRGDGFTVGAHRLFYLEDRVSTRFRSPWDGVWGATLRLHSDRDEGPAVDPELENGPPEQGDSAPLVSHIVYEYIHTRQQDARPGLDAFGRARYYTHSVWRDGWIYNRHTLGTPLFQIDPDRLGEPDRAVTSNILIGHHVGLAGRMARRFDYRLMGTYARHYGMCTDQLPEGGSCRGSEENPVTERENYRPLEELRRDRYSLLLRVSAPLRPGVSPLAPIDEQRELGLGLGLQMELFGAVAVDFGSFHDQDRLGVEAGLRIRR